MILSIRLLGDSFLLLPPQKLKEMDLKLKQPKLFFVLLLVVFHFLGSVIARYNCTSILNGTDFDCKGVLNGSVIVSLSESIIVDMTAGVYIQA